MAPHKNQLPNRTVYRLPRGAIGVKTLLYLAIALLVVLVVLVVWRGLGGSTVIVPPPSPPPSLPSPPPQITVRVPSAPKLDESITEYNRLTRLRWEAATANPSAKSSEVKADAEKQTARIEQELAKLFEPTNSRTVPKIADVADNRPGPATPPPADSAVPGVSPSPAESSANDSKSAVQQAILRLACAAVCVYQPELCPLMAALSQVIPLGGDNRDEIALIQGLQGVANGDSFSDESADALGRVMKKWDPNSDPQKYVDVIKAIRDLPDNGSPVNTVRDKARGNVNIGGSRRLADILYWVKEHPTGTREEFASAFPEGAWASDSERKQAQDILSYLNRQDLRGDQQAR